MTVYRDIVEAYRKGSGSRAYKVVTKGSKPKEETVEYVMADSPKDAALKRLEWLGGSITSVTMKQQNEALRAALLPENPKGETE